MIEMTKANPDIESLKVILYLAGSVLTFLLLIVAYFLKKQISVQEVLAEAVNKLTTAVSVLESQNKDRYPVIERRLNDHAEQIDELGYRVTAIETTCKIYHQKK